MSLSTESQELARRSAQECKALRTLINGNVATLSGLTTSDKSSLVAAINEVAATGGGAGVSELADLDTTGYTAGRYLRLADNPGGVEERTTAQVLSDIGAAAASHTHVTADITDATSDGAANKEKLLKTDASGAVTVAQANVLTLSMPGGVSSVVDVTAQNLTDDRAQNLPDANGTLAITGSATGVPDALANGTISGTVTVASGTTWSYADATAKSAHLTALGVQATGLDLLQAATPAAALASINIAPVPENGTPTAPAGWTEAPDGTYNCTAAGAVNCTIPIAGVIEGGIYILSVSISAYTSGSFSLYLGQSAGNITVATGLNAVRTFNYLIPNISTTALSIILQSAGGGFTGSVRNVRLVRIF